MTRPAAAAALEAVAAQLAEVKAKVLLRSWCHARGLASSSWAPADTLSIELDPGHPLSALHGQDADLRPMMLALGLAGGPRLSDLCAHASLITEADFRLHDEPRFVIRDLEWLSEFELAALVRDLPQLATRLVPPCPTLAEEELRRSVLAQLRPVLERDRGRGDWPSLAYRSGDLAPYDPAGAAAIILELLERQRVQPMADWPHICAALASTMWFLPEPLVRPLRGAVEDRWAQELLQELDAL